MNKKSFRLKVFEKASYCRHFEEQVVKNIKSKNWPIVDRVGGSSGDLEARGSCPVCQINLVGKDERPRDMTFPCGVAGCPYEKKEAAV